MPCAACSGWRSSVADPPGAPPGCYIPPGWIQRTCRAANCYSRSKTVWRTSGGETSQPAGLHGCRPHTHQQETSLQYSSAPSKRCLHWLAATCGRNQQDSVSSRHWGGINQRSCLCRFTARRWHCRAQLAAIFNFQPAASTWTDNLQLLRPQFWLHIIWRTGCKCTPHEAHTGWPNLLRTPCWASLLRLSTGRFGWTGRWPVPGWWSNQRIQSNATGVGNVQILAGSTGPGATERARIRVMGIPPDTAGKSSLENLEILAGTAGTGTAGAGSAAIAGATTGGSTCSAAPRSPGSTGSTGARRPRSGPKYKFCDAADWSRQRAADPTARRSRCTDPAKYGRSGNSSAEPSAEPSESAAPARINLFRARATWYGATVANLCTVHTGSKYAGPIGSGPAESAPSVTTCSPACTA